MQEYIIYFQDNFSLIIVSMFVGILISCLSVWLMVTKCNMFGCHASGEDLTEKCDELETQIANKDNVIVQTKNQLAKTKELLLVSEENKDRTRLITIINEHNKLAHKLLNSTEKSLGLIEYNMDDENNLNNKALWQRFEEVVSHLVDKSSDDSTKTK